MTVNVIALLKNIHDKPGNYRPVNPTIILEKLLFLNLKDRTAHEKIGITWLC